MREPGGAAAAWIAAVTEEKVELRVPDFVYLEVANELLGYVRVDLMTGEEATSELEYVFDVPAQRVSADRLAAQSLALGTVRRLSAYDAAYLALALGTESILVTADRRLAAEAEQSALLPEQGPP